MGLIRPVARVGCLRRLATAVLEEWPFKRGDPLDRTRLTDPLARRYEQLPPPSTQKRAQSGWLSDTGCAAVPSVGPRSKRAS